VLDLGLEIVIREKEAASSLRVVLELEEKPKRRSMREEGSLE